MATIGEKNKPDDFTFSPEKFNTTPLPNYWEKYTHYFSYRYKKIPEWIVNIPFSIPVIKQTLNLLHLKKPITKLVKAPFYLVFRLLDSLYFKIFYSDNYQVMANENIRYINRGQKIIVDGLELKKGEEDVKPFSKEDFNKTYSKICGIYGKKKALQVFDTPRIVLFDSPAKSWIYQKYSTDTNEVYFGPSSIFNETIDMKSQMLKCHWHVPLVVKPREGEADPRKTEPCHIYLNVSFAKNMGELSISKEIKFAEDKND